MALATNPVTSKGLFAAAGLGGKTYEDWLKTAAPGTAMPSIAPGQVDDSVSNRVNEITKGDSPLMQAARTEGLKVANRRGLANSSIAAGATQTAMLEAAVPIAAQEASQAFGANQNARAFEYAMAQQDREIGYQTSERKLDRELQERLAEWNLKSSDRNAAATMVANMEQLYQNQYSTIMGNTAMSANDRSNYLNAAYKLRDRQLNLVQQLYDVKLRW